MGPFKQNITQGEWGSLIFVTKCDKGWVGCFWSVMLHFVNDSIFSIFCFIIGSLVLCLKQLWLHV